MKTETKQALVLVFVVLVAIFIGLISVKKNEYMLISDAKAEMNKKDLELLEAKKPSLIEIQKEELDGLEEKWRLKQNEIQTIEISIEDMKKMLIESENEKLELEPKIRAKRNEILGIKK